MRVIPEYLNPGTTFFVCYAGDEPVGAMAWVTDGEFGLPSDRAFRVTLDALRSEYRLTENTSFTIRTEWRRMTRHIALRLFAGSWRMSGDAEYVATSVTPAGAGFYGQLFGFVPINSCGDLFGAPAVLLGAPKADIDRPFLRPEHPHQLAMSALWSDPDPWFRDVQTDTALPCEELLALAGGYPLLSSAAAT
jgi:hypothetical protein